MIYFGGITRLYIKQEITRQDVMIGVQTLIFSLVCMTFQWLLSFHLSKNIPEINRPKTREEVVVTTLKDFAFYHTHNRYLATLFLLYKLSPLQLSCRPKQTYILHINCCYNLYSLRINGQHEDCMHGCSYVHDGGEYDSSSSTTYMWSGEFHHRWLLGLPNRWCERSIPIVLWWSGRIEY